MTTIIISAYKAQHVANSLQVARACAFERAYANPDVFWKNAGLKIAKSIDELFNLVDAAADNETAVRIDTREHENALLAAASIAREWESDPGHLVGIVYDAGLI